jgi:hypothetical protein
LDGWGVNVFIDFGLNILSLELFEIEDAQEGGTVVGSTRRDIEKRSGKPVVSGENFKGLAGKGKKGIT